MNKVIIEVSGGNVVALHADQSLDIHIVDWDNKGQDNLSWEERCKGALEPDRLIDKSFDRYMNEILGS